MTDKWYKDGLRFECIGCGDCCRTHGDYAYVYLNPFDVLAVAAFLQLETTDFLNEHTLTDEVSGWVHLSMCNGDCNFLNEKGHCKIYMVRPKQCATWPFWTENLVEEVWNGAVTDCCPGIGKGKLHSQEEIESIARERDEWYGIYREED